MVHFVGVVSWSGLSGLSGWSGGLGGEGGPGGPGWHQNPEKKPLKERSKICNINAPPPFGILPKTHLIWYRHSVPSF